MQIRERLHLGRPSFIPVRHGEGMNMSLAGLQEEMNRVFDHFFNRVQVGLTDWNGKYASTPAIDMIENAESFTLKADLAGVDPDDVEVEIQDGFLTIKGGGNTGKEEKDKEEGTYLFRERASGYFKRTVSLPETADCSKAEAAFRNGILFVDIAKKAEALQKPRKLPIRTAA